MTFKHKLSRRLAMLWAAVALSCTPGDMAVAPDAPRFATSPSQVLLQESFEDNSFAARGWYDNSAMATTTTQHIAGSTRALEVHFTSGANTPTWGGAARRLFASSPTLYVSYWVKYSSNWVGSGRAYHPHEFMVLSDQDGDWDGLSNSWLATYIEENYQNGGIPRLQLQDNKAINTTSGALPVNLVNVTENRSVAGCNGTPESNVVTTCFNMPPWYNDKEISAGQVAFQPNSGAGYKGDWNHVEVYLQLNSVVGGIGVADGVMQYWFNGAPKIDRHDILFRTGARPNLQFHQFVIAPYIGDGSPADQYMWVDDLVVATSRTDSTPPDSVPPPPPPAVTDPGSVTDLAVTGVATNSATLSFTEVADGAGLPANYLVRYAVAPLSWGSAAEVAQGTCKVPMAGTTIGAKRTCTVTGLLASSAYQFQLVAYRGTLNVDAVFGALSNVASGTTSASTVAPVATVTLSPTSASVAVGATKQLTVTLKDAAGATLTGRTVTWSSSNTNVATVSGSGLVRAVAVGSATITATSEGKSATSAITATATKPGKVSDLKVVSMTSTSATLSFTEVNDGTGLPASYLVRFALSPISWGSATQVAQGTCAAPMAGTAIGAKRTCTITGLAASKAYQFQLAAFRGTLNVNAVFGALSNVVSGTTPAASTSAPVASVALTPASASLTPGGTQQLAVTLKDAAGSTLTGRTVTWASSNAGVATVSGSGLVTAILAGSATITATSEGMTGTSAIAVSAPTTMTDPGAVSDLAVASVSDNAATLSFTEVTNGAGLPATYLVRLAVSPLSWGSATEVALGTCSAPLVGTVIGAKRTCTVTGLASLTGYQFQLVAYRGTLNVDAVFGALSNVASGTTTGASAPPPPPPPSGGVWPNEPSGFTLLTDEPFNAMVENGWHQVQRQTTNGSGLFLSADAAAPQSASSVLDFKYAAGYTGGSEPGVEYYNPSSPVKETYFAFWWKPSSPWQNHSGSNVNKLAFLFPSAGCIYIMMYGSGGGYTIQVEPEFGGDVRRLAPNVTSTPVVLGTWHRVEWYVKYSTTGSSRDGVARWWLDGVLQGDYRDLQMPGDAGFTEYQIAPTWGGIDGSKTETDHYWFDHARISRP